MTLENHLIIWFPHFMARAFMHLLPPGNDFMAIATPMSLGFINGPLPKSHLSEVKLRCAIYFHHSFGDVTRPGWLEVPGGAFVFGGLYPAMCLVPFRFSWIWQWMFQEQVLELLLMANRHPKVVCKHEGYSTHVKWCCDLFWFLNPTFWAMK